MAASSATHGDDGSDLWSDALMPFPRKGAVIDVWSASDLAKEGRAPKGGADAYLMRCLSEELTGALNQAIACCEAALEAVLEAPEERLLLRLLHAGVVVTMVVTRSRLGSRYGDSKN
jgi:hypothetical protein